MDTAIQLARVKKSVATNTDLACRFVLAELHEMAQRALQPFGVPA